MLNRPLIDSSLYGLPLSTQYVSAEQTQPPTDYWQYGFRLLLASSFIISGGADAAFDVGLSMNELEDKKILGWIEPTNKAGWIIAALYFIQASALNASWARRDIDELYTILKSRALPASWPKLSKQQQYTALIVSSIFTSYAAFAEFVGYVYSIESIGGGKALAYLGGASAAITASLTNYDILKRMWFSKKERKYKNNISKALSLLLGSPLKLMSGVQSTIESYSPVAAKYNITSLAGRWALFGASSTYGIGNIYLYGNINIKALNHFFGKITSGKRPQISEISGFLLAISGSAIFTDLIRCRTTSFFLSPETELPFALYNSLVEILAWGGALSNGTNFTYTSYNLLLDVFQSIETSITSCRSRQATDRASPTIHLYEPTYRLFEDKETDPPSSFVKFAQNRNALFTPPPTEKSSITITIEPDQHDLLQIQSSSLPAKTPI